MPGHHTEAAFEAGIEAWRSSPRPWAPASLIQRDRWERGWEMLAETFRTKVHVTERAGHLTVLRAA